jgi:GrpB-like predicted nucleotidyltransferase (UPF0157 family)
VRHVHLLIGNERRGRGLGPHPHDPRLFDVAAFLASLIEDARPGTVVEHVGSSAVPGLAGKNTLDLMIEAQPSQIPEITETLLSLGFQRQSGRDPFPPTRPMLEGAIRYEGEIFDLHCHVIPAGSWEAGELRAFRDRLRTDPALRKAYVAAKRRIVESGVTSSQDYAIAKSDFVVQVLRDMGLRT